jgi:hypothetical protein
MKRRRGATWADYARELELVTCDGSGPCERGFSSHHRGRVDGDGVIHWEGWGRRATRRGVRFFLYLAALSLNESYRTEPSWLSTYHANTWAVAAAKRLFHLRIRWTQSRTDRARAWDQAVRAARRQKLRLRTDYPGFYSWVWWRGYGDGEWQRPLPSTRRMSDNVSRFAPEGGGERLG